MYEFTVYSVPLILSAIVIALLMIYSWRYRQNRIAIPFLFTMGFSLIWIVTTIAELYAVELSVKLFWADISFLGIASLPYAWLTMIYRYGGHNTRRRSNLLIASYSIPIITNIMIWTNPLHGLWRGVANLDTISAPFTIVIYDYQIWFYLIHAMSGYVLFLLAFLLLVRQITITKGTYRQQAMILFTATLLPTISDIIYVAGLSPIPNFNLTPIIFGISGVLIAGGVLRSRFLDVVPIARDRVIDSIDDMMLVMDTQNRIIDSNLSAQNFWSSHPSLIGLCLPDLLPQQAVLFDALLQREKTREIVVVKKDEQTYHLEIKLSTIYQNQVSIGNLILLRDVSEQEVTRQALETSEASFRKLINDAPLSILIVNSDGQIVLANKSAETLFSYESGMMLGLSMRNLVPEEVHEVHQENIATFFDGHKMRSPFMAVEIDTRGVDCNGRHIPISVTLGYTELNQAPVALAFITDITEKVAFKGQQAKLALEKQSKTIIANFIQDASHEFRTPLSIIETNLYLLEHHTDVNKRQQRYQNIHLQTQRINTLITHLTHMTRLDSEINYPLKLINLTLLVKSLLRKYDHQFTSRQLILVSDLSSEALMIRGHQDDLLLAISHVVENAINFSHDAGKITISSYQSDEHQATLTICDEGVGMSDDVQAQMFDRFYRADSAHTTFGLGLGLPITQRIITLHSGTITCTSALEQGTTITINIPLNM